MVHKSVCVYVFASHALFAVLEISKNNNNSEITQMVQFTHERVKKTAQQQRPCFMA